jgi:NADP-dependent 3-hydroxy acid dehydrogenase YdfG
MPCVSNNRSISHESDQSTGAGQPYNIRTTGISPGAVATELPDAVTEPDLAQDVRELYELVAIPADSFANMVIFAMSQPDDVDLNEILFRPTRQEL